MNEKQKQGWFKFSFGTTEFKSKLTLDRSNWISKQINLYIVSFFEKNMVVLTYKTDFERNND